MDIATLVGLLCGFLTIIIAMLVSGSLLMYWDLLSLLVVLIGAAFSVLVRWPIGAFISGMQSGLTAVMNNIETPEELIEKICDLADKARKSSILALEKEQIDNEFMAKGVKLAVDGADPEVLEEILAEDMVITKRKLKDGAAVYEDMGEACPAFGMIGTVLGLIVIMANLSDPSKIGPGLAVALVTTLYGAGFANMFFIPIAKKLKYNVTMQTVNQQIIQTGVISIVKGINPNLIRERLNAHLDE
jgi:chemotaxis protein MotA